MAKLPPIHPGEVLLEEFLKPLGLSGRAFANSIGVPTNRVTRIINGQSRITADTARRFEKAFGTSAEMWLNLQSRYDLRQSRWEQPDMANIERLVSAD